MSTSSNMVLIETKTVGAGGSSTIEFTGIPQTGYTDLQLVASLRMSGSSSPHAMLSFNNTNTSSFSLKNLIRYSTGSVTSQSESAAAMRGLYATLSGDTANTFSNGSIYIPNYAGSTNKSISIDSVQEDNSNDMDMGITAGLWPYTNAITSIKLTADASQSFVQGSSVSLYGIKSSSKVSPAKATGGVISYIPGYVVHTFTASGTFTPTANLTDVEYLVIAGGGGGGAYQAGGGGAGGYRSSVTGQASGGGASAESKLSLTASTPYTVTIGAGGAGGESATSGSNSTFATITSTGGGRGGSTNMGWAGLTGGSGGGGARGELAGSGTTGQGYAGGYTGADTQSGSGGGGAGAIGTVATNNNGGAGGVGVQSSINGVATYRAGGGGGGSFPGGGAGAGGNGGGGTGGAGGFAVAGTVNTGGGGGGGTGNGNTPGAAGGSGIVIVRYAA